MFILKVRGPFDVPCYSGRGGRSITDENVEEFWRENGKWESRKGCYVFAMRAGKGYTPGYVGKATKGFKREVFQHHKRTHYQLFLVDYAKGRPVLFFLVAPVQKGKANNSQISKIEKYLIDLAILANPELTNERGTKSPNWGIQGIIRGKKGKTSEATQAFRTMMSI